MARNEFPDEVVSWAPQFGLVPDRSDLIRFIDEPLSADRQPLLLQRRDTVSDQADGVRGHSEDVCPESKPCWFCEANSEDAWLPPRRGTETGR